jgi:NADH:ubiquinone oxidoreductase subunit 5 (subunit L)/multisubunit Na+/H+ antiporter MnhA subunit
MVSNKLITATIKMYMVYYLLQFLLCLLCMFSYVSLNSVVMMFLNLIKVNVYSYYLALSITLVAVLILLNSINYLSYVESFYFMLLLLSFYLVMVMFVFASSLLLLFVCWEYLGIVSYLLINFWLTRVNCGIKTLLYNKVGDLCFMLVLALMYSTYYTFSLIVLELFLVLSYAFMLLLLVVYISKSAMLPFSSWLISAMAAATPVSALLHSSTMVIAGTLVGCVSYGPALVYVMLNSYYSFLLYSLALYLVTLTLIYSCFYLLYVSDIKSLIAYSTINQLAYIFLSLFSFNSAYSIYHICTHAFFKSMLFLLAGSLIHVCSSAQSLYRLKSSCSLLKSLFAISLLLSLLNFSKEFILHYAHLSLCLASHFYVFSFSIIVTVAYSLKLFTAIFSAPSASISHNNPPASLLSLASVSLRLVSLRSLHSHNYSTSHPIANSVVTSVSLPLSRHLPYLSRLIPMFLPARVHIHFSFSSFVLIFYALTVLVVDSLFAAVFSSVSLSYNSFPLASALAVSLIPVPLNLYMLVFAFSVSFAFYFNIISPTLFYSSRYSSWARIVE